MAVAACQRLPRLRQLLGFIALQPGAPRRPQRAFSTTAPAPGPRILTVEQIFSTGALHSYLRRLQAEYRDCLQEEESRGKTSRLPFLRPLVLKIRELEEKQRELEETEGLLKENDPDLQELALTEKENCLMAVEEIKQQILSALIPEEEVDMSDLVLEVTAGIGGQEAMLFTAEIFNMYQKYAFFHGWGFDTLDFAESEIGGIRHAAAIISGPQSYKKMKFEAGVHRVQRIPKTGNRMHTSTMTVAILPQPTEIAFTINPKDLKIETKKASGAGGQHVNTTDSAVRIVHLPTGIVSECQQERSQLRNKEIAMTVLRAKLYSAKLEEETSKRYQARKLQIGTKGRSEKIRTYNFDKDRVTDHRIGKTLYNVNGFFQGEDLLEEMSLSLQQFSDQEALMDLLEDSDTDGPH